MSGRQKIEFGDFQTPLELATKIVRAVSDQAPSPSIVVEPTCGTGSFIRAGLAQWGNTCRFYGLDINSEYVETARQSLAGQGECTLETANFFDFDWGAFFGKHCNGDVVVIGNPPWVTNAVLGSLNSGNVPRKKNFQGLDGFAAKTGKANFDIAEWMIIRLIEKLEPYCGYVALLCKTATARRTLRHCWVKGISVHGSSIHLINARKYFNAAVDACLLVTRVGGKKQTDAKVYADVGYDKQIGHIGFVGNELIADVDKYYRFKEFEGIDHYGWRSGIKHDAARVMELVSNGTRLLNGFGEAVEIEDTYVYPLLKSSDLAHGRAVPQRALVVTQTSVGEETAAIESRAPRTWKYLLGYAATLDNRKSIIYRNRPRFCIFGVGEYSFATWKVAVSGLYKAIRFVTVGPHAGKPVVIDDTCYSIPCGSEQEADLLCGLLNSEVCMELLSSLIFFDAKRPVNVDVLKRVDLEKVADHYGVGGAVREFIAQRDAARGLLKWA